MYVNVSNEENEENEEFSYVHLLIAMPKRLSSRLILVCMLLTHDRSIDDTTPPKKRSIARTSWSFYCHSSRHTHSIGQFLHAEPYRFTMGPTSSLIISNVLARSALAVSAIWHIFYLVTT